MATITGHVRTPGGRPVAGIHVSNGQEVVAADADGCFSMDADPRIHPFVFATRPDITGDSRWFARLPADDGRLELIVSTPAHRPKRQALSIGHITDLHLEVGTREWMSESIRRDQSRRLLRVAHPPDVTPALLSRDLARVSASTPHVQLLIATGDLTNLGDLPSLRALHRVSARSPVAIVPMYGGCDGLTERLLLNTPSPHTRHWESIFGPTYYSFDMGRWHVVIYPDEDAMFGPDRATIKRCWLMNDLASANGRPIVMARHTHPRSEEAPWLGELARQGVKLLLFGHLHSSRCYESAGTLLVGTPPLCVGGMDMMPRGYRVLELGRSSIRTTHHPLPAKRYPRPSGRSAVKQEVWRKEFPGSLHCSPPTFSGDDLFVPLMDEENRHAAGVACISAANGRLRWLTRTPDSVRSSIAVHEDQIFGITFSGELFRLERQTGKLVWSARLEGYPHRWIASSPTVVEEVVIAGTAFGGIEAFDANTGRRSWKWTYPGGTGDRWPHYGRHIRFGRCFCTRVHRTGVTCLSARNGRIRWHFGAHYGHDSAPLLLSGDRLLVPDRGRIHVVDPSRGRRIWTRRIGPTSVLNWQADESMLILNLAASSHPPRRGLAQARRAGNGDVLWQVEYGTDRIDMMAHRRGSANAWAAPLLTPDAVWLGGLDGVLRRIDRLTGRTLARQDLGHPVMSLQKTHDSRLIVTTFPGTGVSLKIQEEALR